MVCGGDVTVLFTFIPASDASWRALASSLLERIAKYQPCYLSLPLTGQSGYLTDEPPKDGAFSLPILFVYKDLQVQILALLLKNLV